LTEAEEGRTNPEPDVIAPGIADSDIPEQVIKGDASSTLTEAGEGRTNPEPDILAADIADSDIPEQAVKGVDLVSGLYMGDPDKWYCGKTEVELMNWYYSEPETFWEFVWTCDEYITGN